jgi:hypothetical protein
MVDGAVGAPTVSRPAGTYSAGAATTISNPTTGEPDDVGVVVSYDPEENSRGAIDDVAEPALKNACGSVQICTGGR